MMQPAVLKTAVMLLAIACGGCYHHNRYNNGYYGYGGGYGSPAYFSSIQPANFSASNVGTHAGRGGARFSGTHRSGGHSRGRR